VTPERERLSVPHAARDPQILKDRNLENEDIFELIKKPPKIGAVRIFEQPELWDTSIGPTKAVTTQGIATIYLPSGPLSEVKIAFIIARKEIMYFCFVWNSQGAVFYAYRSERL